MSEHRHTYWQRHPRDFANEYTIIAIPEDKAPPAQDGWTKLSRDDALARARWTPDKHNTAHVTVDPCPCGDCGLGQYASKHPHSPIGKRARFTEHLPGDARARQRDAAILGPRSDEYKARWDPFYEPKESVA